MDQLLFFSIGTSAKRDIVFAIEALPVYEASIGLGSLPTALPIVAAAIRISQLGLSAAGGRALEVCTGTIYALGHLDRQFVHNQLVSIICRATP